MVENDSDLFPSNFYQHNFTFGKKMGETPFGMEAEMKFGRVNDHLNHFFLILCGRCKKIMSHSVQSNWNSIFGREIEVKIGIASKQIFLKKFLYEKFWSTSALLSFRSHQGVSF